MKQRKGKLIGQVVGISCIAAAVGCIILSIIGMKEVKDTYLDMTEEELHTAVTIANSEFTNMWDGDWDYKDSVLTKGGEPVYDEYLTTMEELKADTNLEYTIFYNDTRAVTTLKKQGTDEYFINTQASAEVVDTVINGNKVLYKPDMTIEGHQYYGYYLPLSNDDGTRVGMMFVGRDATTINATIFRVSAVLIGVTVIVVLVPLVLSMAHIRVATDDDRFLPYWYAAFFVLVGAVSFLQIAGWRSFWFWTWTSNGNAVKSSLLKCCCSMRMNWVMFLLSSSRFSLRR